MIYIQKNSQNEIIVRVNDLSDTVGEEYEFIFEHETQKTPMTCVLIDVSLFPYRYSQFTLTLPDDLPNLTKDGEYSVKIKKEGNLLWTGKAFVDSVKYEEKINDVQLGNNHIYEGDR